MEKRWNDEWATRRDGACLRLTHVKAGTKGEEEIGKQIVCCLKRKITRMSKSVTGRDSRRCCSVRFPAVLDQFPLVKEFVNKLNERLLFD